MNVLVCFKTVPDLDQLAGRFEIDGGTVETGFVKTMINPYDESALEMALRLAESAKAPVRLTALTMGGPGTDRDLKTLYALQFHRAVRIDTGEDVRFHPERIASLLCRYVRQYPQDLLLMGRQSGEGDNAKTPLLAAELLQWPCITQVTGLAAGAGGTLEMTGLADGGVLRQRVRPPLVAAVGNAPSAFLRVPTLQDRVTHGKRPVELLDRNGLASGGIPETAGVEMGLKGLSPICRRREGRIIEGSTPAEKARVLYDTYLKGWLPQR